MQVEKKLAQLSNVERELHLKNWLNRHDIKRFFFDLDDTIAPTKPIFNEKAKFASILMASLHPEKDSLAWKKEIGAISNRLFEEYSVQKIRWDVLTQEMKKTFNLSETLSSAMQRIFASVYQTPYQMFPEAHDTLAMFKKINFPMSIVTHADETWTWQKYIWFGLGEYIAWDDVHIIDARGHKDFRSWKSVCDSYRVKPVNIASAGDSPRSDILPSLEAGIKQTFLINNPDRWSIHNLPVPDSVHQISHIGHLIDTIIRLDLENK